MKVSQEAGDRPSQSCTVDAVAEAGDMQSGLLREVLQREIERLPGYVELVTPVLSARVGCRSRSGNQQCGQEPLVIFHGWFRCRPSHTRE